MTESEIQTKVVQFVRTFYPDTLIFSIPNGAHTTTKNRVRLSKEGLLAGAPDLAIMEPRHGFHGLFIELKTEDGVVFLYARRPDGGSLLRGERPAARL